jgi:D-alanyl-D-alanine carboxypeptidase/D-alanyl-D-alanine-endopeptidase (penicillin-binding protein 4)
MKENRMKFFLSAWLVFCAVDFSRAQPTNVAHSVGQLAADIDAHISQSRFDGALWGVKVVSLDSGLTIFESHPDRLMSPASNSKMYPAALALTHFGPDYKIVTPILASAKPDSHGTIHGNLVISGRGDPSWNAKHAGTNFADLFAPFVAELKKTGVRRVTGDLIGDTTFFHSTPNGSGWTVDDLEDSDGAEISALTLADNYTSIRVTPGRAGEPCHAEVVDPFTKLEIDNQTLSTTNGGRRAIVGRRFRGENVVHLFGSLPVGGEAEIVEMPVLRPAEWFTAALKSALQKNGIVVKGTARVVAWPSPPPVAGEKIGEISSPPLSEILADFLKPSQNLETDLIFQHTGETLRPPDTRPWETSEDCALVALHHFLATNGLPAGDVHFDEGSGLSRNNLTTANASVALLQFMAKSPAAAQWESALPIAGVDGTLRRRMKNTPAAGNVHGKTGTLRWVNALSGYVTNAAGEKMVFSLMLNRYDSPPDRKRTDELDDIAVMLARSDFRTDGSLIKTFAPFGTLMVTQFVSAPFPHPDRANGHKYHNDLYSAAEHYSNSDVALFIPKNFRATDKIDFVVHFHGWRHTVATTLPEYKLIEQLSDSGKNAILIVPQGPYNAPDSFDGKLCDTNGFARFIAEAMDKLRGSGLVAADGQVGRVIISGHSGGYGALMAIADHGGMPDNLREIWIFDALYAGTENFVAWQKKQNGRLLDIYTDHGGTDGNSRDMMAGYQTNGVPFVSLEETNSVTADLQKEKIVFIHTDEAHDETVYRRQEFEKFLKTSCLEDK